MEAPRCHECGETGRPLVGGVCLHRAGCEHRVLQHEAEMARLYEQMRLLDPLPCGCTGLEHAGMRSQINALRQSWAEGYGPDWPDVFDPDDWR